MIRFNDFILLITVFSSMLAGILFPRYASIFKPFPLYTMMFLLFLSFLSIRFNSIIKTIKEQKIYILWLLFLKLIVLPTGIYFLFKIIFPRYALGSLLITGVSTGVVAPFIASIVNANGPLVLVMVVISSLIVPITLPVLVEVFLGRILEIPLLDMISMLSVVVFVPLVFLEILRKFTPVFIEKLNRRKFPISLTIFAIINLGVFSKYSEFFRQNPITIVEATLVALALGAIYFIVGILSFWNRSTENQMASVITFSNMNNVLVIVFSSDFFGPLEPTLAAVYMIPFFGIILPIRLYQNRKNLRLKNF
jgi:BASS family bile acid:Na+ symporter